MHQPNPQPPPPPIRHHHPDIRGRQGLYVPYVHTLDVDPQGRGNFTLRGPTGFRVYIPPIEVRDNNNNNVPASGRDRYPDFDRHDPTHPHDYTGNLRPFFRGMMVLGPQPTRFIISLSLFVVILVVIALQAQDIDHHCGKGTAFLGLLVSVVTFSAFVVICLSDPGVIPENYTLRELISETEGYRQRNPGARFYRYCISCRGFRPPRSKHCDDCDICIRSHETHLLTGGICIGQRTSRSLLHLCLTTGLLTAYLIAVSCVILRNTHGHKDRHVWNRGMAILSMILGMILFCIPQTGIIIFLFRIFLIGSGHTATSYIYRKMDWMSCPPDSRPLLENYYEFFFGKRNPSVFRKRRDQVAPGETDGDLITEAEWDALLSIPEPGLHALQELVRLRDEQLIQRNQDVFNNNNVVATVEEVMVQSEHEYMEQLAADARPKTIPSDPALQSRELETALSIPGQKHRKWVKPKTHDILHQQIQEIHNLQRLPRSQITTMSLKAQGAASSEGSIPLVRLSAAGGGNMGGLEVTMAARAQQLRRLIHLVITRDRSGLIEMGRQVNIAALLGVDRFDPDNFLFVELSNGLPMLAPRRPENQIYRGQGQFGGPLGIPQMVAAGLLPPARELVNDIENQTGMDPGSIRRIPQHIGNRYVYQIAAPQPQMQRSLIYGYPPPVASPHNSLLNFTTQRRTLIVENNSRALRREVIREAREHLNRRRRLSRDRDVENRSRSRTPLDRRRVFVPDGRGYVCLGRNGILQAEINNNNNNDNDNDDHSRLAPRE